jgi:hypothetical protein
MIMTDEKVSTFALIVDKLRGMDEAELKLVYMKLFKDDIIRDWAELTSQMNFGDTTDEDILKAVQEKRYGTK